MTTLTRRRTLHALASVPFAIALTSGARAQAGGTLAQIKQRGVLRVGVTQAPPWYSKDPKSGEWSTGLGVSMGRAMAGSLGVKF